MRFRSFSVTLLLLAAVLVGCSSSSTGPKPGAPAPPIVTPPDPNPPPVSLTTVQQVNAGATGTVLMYGQLVRIHDASDDEYVFSDGTGEIVMDFPRSQVPALDTGILVLGSVDQDEDGKEIDVADWEPIGTEPPPPINPPVTPIPPNPPATITSVKDILDGNSAHTVVVAGELTGPTSDSDEWVFSDGTGSIVLDFPSSGHIPAVGLPIYARGTVSSSEIDVDEWQPQN